MAKVITLGEILLRFSTTVGQRLENADALNLHYGGSEANVSIGLSSFGHNVSLLSAIPDNSLGKGAVKHLKQFDVETNNIILSDERLGSYYVETGSGPRATNVVYDRADSAFSNIAESPWDFKTIFTDVDLFHVSGITPALSEDLTNLTILCMKEAKKRGVLVSFDSNYRGKLWSLEEAGKAYEMILPYVDYCSMGKLDAINILKIEPSLENLSEKDELAFYCGKTKEMYPNIQLFYSTLRKVNSSNDNHLTGTLWIEHQLYMSKEYHIPYIVDRIGGGDAFTSGILHGLLNNEVPQKIIDFGTGNAVLKHTLEGDACHLSEVEVAEFISSNSSKINR